MRDTGECFLTLYSCFFGFIPRRPKRKPKIHIKSPGGSMSTGVIFILGKGGSPILASGVKSTWPQGSSAPGFSTCRYSQRQFQHILHRYLLDKHSIRPCGLSRPLLRACEWRRVVRECELRCFAYARECRVAPGLPRQNPQSAQRCRVQSVGRGRVSGKRESGRAATQSAKRQHKENGLRTMFEGRSNIVGMMEWGSAGRQP